MRALILALAIVSTPALADKWLEMPNQAGGKILLLPDRCTDTENGRMVIATMPEGTNISGCWWFFADMVHIVWKGGKTSSFEPNAFTVRERK